MQSRNAEYYVPSLFFENAGEKNTYYDANHLLVNKKKHMLKQRLPANLFAKLNLPGLNCTLRQSTAVLLYNYCACCIYIIKGPSS